MTAPRYVSRYIAIEDAPCKVVEQRRDESGRMFYQAEIVRHDDIQTAELIAAALNAYNQPQEQEQKQEVPK